jgi:pimeloyl-ACP methyl ester carboxylesterase
MLFLTGSADRSRNGVPGGAARFRAGAFQVDEGTGLMVYVPGFRSLLGGLDVPVLAIFGEKDGNVDWRKTRALYAETIGRNPRARLTVKTFPDGNHNLHRSGTGGYREMLEILRALRKMSDGYYETILEWLRTEVLGAEDRGAPRPSADASRSGRRRSLPGSVCP